MVIDPFPFNLEQLKISDVLVRGRKLAVQIQGKRFTVWLDGKQHAESTIDKAITIQI